jgi:hypothetical protein
MSDREQQQLVEWILEQVGVTNPYNRFHENKKSEFYIYQAGYLAAYLASLMREDPYVYKRFKDHVAKQRLRPKSK